MTWVHHSRIPCVNCPRLFAFDLLTECVYVFRISCKDLKSMLSQVNYRVPNMRFLREKLPVNLFCSAQTFLTLSAHFPFTAVLVKACDLLITIPPSSFLSATGFRDEERRCVVQPVRPALSQPHVRRTEKRECGHLYVEMGQSLSPPPPPSPQLMHSRATLPLPSVCSQMTA